jgi:hypothetical protein
MPVDHFVLQADRFELPDQLMLVERPQEGTGIEN